MGRETPKCFECNALGHKLADCALRRARLEAEKTCFRCNGLGHVSASCPQRFRVSKLVTCREDDNESVTVEPPMAIWCRTCGVKGHVASKCPEVAFMRRIRAKQGNKSKNSSILNDQHGKLVAPSA